MSWYILFLAKLQGRGNPLSEDARRGASLWDYPLEHLVVIRDEKVSPLVKFEKILPLICCILDPLTNKRCKTWSYIINLWIDKAKVQYLLRVFKRKSFGEYDAVRLPSFTWKFFMVWFHKILKLFFQKQPSCFRNKCSEHWRKLPNLTTFLEIFLHLRNNDPVEHV